MSYDDWTETLLRRLLTDLKTLQLHHCFLFYFLFMKLNGCFLLPAAALSHFSLRNINVKSSVRFYIDFLAKIVPQRVEVLMKHWCVQGHERFKILLLSRETLK